MNKLIFLLLMPIIGLSQNIENKQMTLNKESEENKELFAKLKEEEQLDEKLIRVRNVRSGAIRSVSSAFRKIYKKQGWNAVQGTRR